MRYLFKREEARTVGGVDGHQHAVFVQGLERRERHYNEAGVSERLIVLRRGNVETSDGFDVLDIKAWVVLCDHLFGQCVLDAGLW